MQLESPTAVAWCAVYADGELQITWSSGDARQQLGHAAADWQTRNFLIAQTATEDRDQLRSSLAALFNEQCRHVVVRHRLLAEDGHTISVLTHAYRGQDGEIQGSTVDDSARSEVEEELRDLRATTDAMFDNSPAPLWKITLEGNFVAANPAAYRLLEAEPDDVIGHSYKSFFTDESNRKLAAALSSRAVGIISTYEAELITKSGARRRVVITGAPVRDAQGTVRWSSGTCTDVTDQRRLSEERERLLEREQAARIEAEAAHARVRFLFRATSGMMTEGLELRRVLQRLVTLPIPYFCDVSAVSLVKDEWNLDLRAAARLDVKTGRIEEDPKDGVLVEAEPLVNEVISTGHPLMVLEVTGTTAAGVLLRDVGIGSFLAVPLWARNQFLGVLGFGRYAERARYHDGDRELAESLAERVALVIDNARLYRDAQLAIAARDEFLAVASHELRTPLTSLRLAMQRYLKETNEPVTVTKLAAAAEHQITRLNRLTASLLDVSQIQMGRLQLHLDRVDLDTLIRDVCAQYEEDAIRSGSRIVVEMAPDLKGLWDPERLARVFGNLLGNAIKYGRGAPIVLHAERRGDEAEISVRDQGIGIDPEQHERIFDRFERGGSIWHYAGLGLGLYIVRRLVEAHGGSVRVDSKPGEGSTFTVALPLAGPHPVEKQARPDWATRASAARPGPRN